VLVLGLAVRLAHLAAIYRSPFFRPMSTDPGLGFDEWAQSIAAGRWIDTSPFWIDPLYSYLLGVFYRVLGHGLLIPRVINLTLGLAAAYLVALTARRVWASREAGVIAAAASVFFVPALYYEGQTEKTALTIVLFALGFELLQRPGTRVAVAAGVVAGLATLARGNLLIFVPLGALALAAGWDEEDLGQKSGRCRARRAGLFLAGALPVVGLATVHNYAASRELVLTTTNLGINLYLGNHDGNEHGYFTPPDFLDQRHRSEQPHFRAEALRRTGRPMTDAELSRYWTAQTLQAMAAKPGLALRRTVHKLQLVLHNDEVADQDDIALMVEYSPVLRLPIVWWGTLLPMAVLGAVTGWRRRRVRVLVAGSALYLATLLPFFIMGRLRIQVLPALAVLGAGGLLWIVERLRSRDRRALLRGAVLLAACAVVVLARPDWMTRRRNSLVAIDWNNLGSALLERGDTPGAIRAYERAVSVNAASVPAALRVLGQLYFQRGEYARAEVHMRRVLELRPDSRSALAALTALYDAMLQDPRYRDDAELRRRRAALQTTEGPR
jgi:tetratricopeptide (TPR) repeat protein